MQLNALHTRGIVHQWHRKKELTASPCVDTHCLLRYTRFSPLKLGKSVIPLYIQLHQAADASAIWFLSDSVKESGRSLALEPTVDTYRRPRITHTHMIIQCPMLGIACGKALLTVLARKGTPPVHSAPSCSRQPSPGNEQK